MEIFVKVLEESKDSKKQKMGWLSAEEIENRVKALRVSAISSRGVPGEVADEVKGEWPTDLLRLSRELRQELFFLAIFGAVATTNLRAQP